MEEEIKEPTIINSDLEKYDYGLKVYNACTEKFDIVFRIFCELFGINNVDIQNIQSFEEFNLWFKDYEGEDIYKFNDLVSRIKSAIFPQAIILVYFKSVRVTNEYDKFVDIDDLFVKVKLDSNGTLIGGFTMNRSTYSYIQMYKGYMHSHISSIPTCDFTQFQEPCLGSGPIRHTIGSLNVGFDEDLWQLFCYELSKYVTVESIEGTPYNRLENLGADNINGNGNSSYTVYPNFPTDTNTYPDDIIYIKEFIKHFIRLKVLKFNFINNQFSIAMPMHEFIILISNEFISWYNDKYNKGIYTVNFDTLKRHSVLKSVVIQNNRIYNLDNNRNMDYSRYIGKRVCTFKGKEILLQIIGTANENLNQSVVLNPSIALFILTNILKVLNYRYGKGNPKPEFSGEKALNQPCVKTCYL